MGVCLCTKAPAGTIPSRCFLLVLALGCLQAFPRLLLQKQGVRGLRVSTEHREEPQALTEVRVKEE